MKKMEKKTNSKSGEQLDLIDVGPKKSKAIVKAAMLYRKAQAERLNFLAEEIAQKKIILDLVRKEKLQPLDDGKIKFRCNDVQITITPRDELITIKGFAEEPEP